MQALQVKAQEGFAGLVAYFGENPNSIPSDSTFWSPIAKFAQIFSAIQQEVLAHQKVCGSHMLDWCPSLPAAILRRDLLSQTQRMPVQRNSQSKAFELKMKNHRRRMCALLDHLVLLLEGSLPWQQELGGS